jgi:hypothetical protein
MVTTCRGPDAAQRKGAAEAAPKWSLRSILKSRSRKPSRISDLPLDGLACRGAVLA